MKYKLFLQFFISVCFVANLYSWSCDHKKDPDGMKGCTKKWKKHCHDWKDRDGCLWCCGCPKGHCANYITDADKTGCPVGCPNPDMPSYAPPVTVEIPSLWPF